MKISQKRKEKKERKERLYRPRSAGERAAGRRAALYGALTLMFCILLIAGAAIAYLFIGNPPKKDAQPTATEATETTHTYTVVIDPGHGGGNIGELLFEELAECDFTMALAEEIAELLREEGCNVIFTRTADAEEPISDEKRIKGVAGDCMISLHTCVDEGVYYSLLSDTTEYSSYLAEYFGTPIAESEHMITRPTSVPCVLLGVNENAEAQAIADGIMGYLKRFVK